MSSAIGLLITTPTRKSVWLPSSGTLTNETVKLFEAFWTEFGSNGATRTGGHCDECAQRKTQAVADRAAEQTLVPDIDSAVSERACRNIGLALDEYMMV